MNSRLGVRHLVPLLAFLSVALVLPSSAGAVLGGNNGRILFTSGRDGPNGNDSEAKLFLRTTVGSFLAGVTGPTITGTPGVQHRHATWAPDRERIVYARGAPGSFATENYDIYIQDLTAPGSVPMAITNTSDNVTSDRPAWSPDGTRIVFDNEVGNNIGQRDLKMYDVATGQTTDFATAAGVVESDPAWTPDSSEVYYQTGDPNGVNTLDIVKKAAAGGAPSNIAASPGSSEFQASISPDGKNMCFTRGTGFNDTTDIVTALTNGGGQTILSDDNIGGTGDINCTWSPNGTQVLYTRGIFTNGGLVVEKADNSEAFPFPVEDDPMNFDGNSDWAPDGGPTCDDVTVQTDFGQPVEVPLTCRDTGPDYEKTNVQSTISEQPTSGTLTGVVQGGQSPSNTSTVTYTPNAGFTGTDTFQFNSFDSIGFGPVRSTATINVREKPVVNPPPGDTNAPMVSGITMKPKKWRRTAKPKKSRTSVGTKIGFTLSEGADVTFRFKRKKGKRFVSVGKKTLTGRPVGASKVKFRGKLNKGKLKVGKYRMNVSAIDAAGNASKVVRGPAFRIVAR